MAFIELKNINKTFFPNTNREHYALKNIDLVINKGDFITIIGGNGAGKSTLFNAISGVFPLIVEQYLLMKKIFLLQKNLKELNI